MDESTSKAIDELTRLMSTIDKLMRGQRFDADHTRWHLNVRFTLNDLFGSRNTLTRAFAQLDWQVPSGTIYQGYDLEAVIEEKRTEAYRSQLQTARGVLQAAIDQLTRYGLSGVRSANGLVSSQGNRNVFLSHGGKSPVLEKVERIVRVLGFNPIVVELEASSGKAVDDLVGDQMRKCICAIIIATADQDNLASKYPRPNVIHEIGLAQEILQNHVVYLKEKGLDFPSNVAPKVWETFTNDNPEPVWDKVVR